MQKIIEMSARDVLSFMAFNAFFVYVGLATFMKAFLRKPIEYSIFSSLGDWTHFGDDGFIDVASDHSLDPINLGGRGITQNYSNFKTVCLFAFFFFTNIVLMNLLIAQMSSRYNKISEQSDMRWKFERCKLLREYFFSETAPPPLTIIDALMIKTSALSTKGDSRRIVDVVAGRSKAVYEATNGGTMYRAWGRSMVKESREKSG